ncbi:hypothetical protein ABGM23_004806 [Escherichia albertii]|uniref:MrpH family fimbial adhesin n=1 Tax=Escherichia albertii TaxID=208962 RepID=UPI0021D43192|nr:hypothetical protein [Escherichia albertii]MCU7272995.1 hypothetical protein [Escherichia albertii]
MKKTIVLLYLGMFFFPTQGETMCLGYYSDPASIGISSQWKEQGDNFSSANMKGTVSWPTGHAIALYKSSLISTPGAHTGHTGNDTTYSIALPKKVLAKGVPLDVTVFGRIPFNTPLNRDYNAWLIHSVDEGCRKLPNPGWNVVNDTLISAGNVTILLQGQGLASGVYHVQLPYTIAWRTDRNQSESERVKGTWTEINPVNKTGFFDISFEVKNKCDISDGGNINFDYGSLTPGEINRRKKEVNRMVSCLSSTELSLSLSSSSVDLKNGTIAKIKVKDLNNNEIKVINVKDNHPTGFKVESELEVNNKITEGGFSGSSILYIKYR